MNFQTPSSETFEKYHILLRLLTNLNELNDSSLSKQRFTWAFQGDRLYIDAVPTALANLLALLWSYTEHYVFYMYQEDGKSFIEVLYM